MIDAPYAADFIAQEDAQLEADSLHERENALINDYLASDENADFVCAVGLRLDCSYILRDLVEIAMADDSHKNRPLRRYLEKAIRETAREFIKAEDNAAQEAWELRHVD
jgi:hypothetical protein